MRFVLAAIFLFLASNVEASVCKTYQKRIEKFSSEGLNYLESGETDKFAKVTKQLDMSMDSTTNHYILEKKRISSATMKSLESALEIKNASRDLIEWMLIITKLQNDVSLKKFDFMLAHPEAIISNEYEALSTRTRGLNDMIGGLKRGIM